MLIGRIYRNKNEEYGIVKNQFWYGVEEWKRNDLGIENFLIDDEFLTPDISEPTCKINNESLIWLPPIARPGKIICVGRNYLEHALEQDKTAEEKPLLFSKYSSSLTGHLSQVPYPQHTENLDYEVELAVVIGKKATKILLDENPMDYVFGYSVANDVTARDVQKEEKQWTRGKAFDYSLPIGPTIVTSDEVTNPSSREIWLTVNSEKRQLSNTSNMIFDIPYLIRYISQDITLEPGDIILTGTPSGVGFYMDPKATLNPGDLVACGITGIGELRFTIEKSNFYI